MTCYILVIGLVQFVPLFETDRLNTNSATSFTSLHSVHSASIIIILLSLYSESGNDLSFYEILWTPTWCLKTRIINVHTRRNWPQKLVMKPRVECYIDDQRPVKSPTPVPYGVNNFFSYLLTGVNWTLNPSSTTSLNIKEIENLGAIADAFTVEEFVRLLYL